MQETANKQKRITLKTVHEMLDGMSVELAEKVHLLCNCSVKPVIAH